MLRLYDCLESGNGYKVRLLLSQLGKSFERVELNVYTQETRSPEYRARNSNFRIPMLEWSDGRRLAESNAILFYLAAGTDFLPADDWERAKVLQWQNFEQYSHEPFIAVLRFWHHADTLEENEALIPGKLEGGRHALGVMEDHLSRNDFFAGGRYTIADISLYAYTHVAHEGGFDLSQFPSVSAWLARVKGQPDHILITDDVGVPVEWNDVRNEAVTR